MRRFMMRAAAILLVMLLTTASAWADNDAISYIDMDGETLTNTYFDENGGILTLKGDLLKDEGENGSIVLPQDVDKDAVLEIVVDKAGATFPQNSSYLFHEFTNVRAIYLQGANTNNVTNMEGMFSDCEALKTLDISSFNTSSVENMARMFANCKALETLDISSFNTNNVTNMEGMFSYCEALKTLDISSFNTSSVENMAQMFANCNELVAIYAGPGWSKENVTSDDNMFNGCTSLFGGKSTYFEDKHIDSEYARPDGEKVCVDDVVRPEDFDALPGYLRVLYSLTLPDNVEDVTEEPYDKKVGSKYLEGGVVKLRYTGEDVPADYILTVKANGTNLTATDGVYTFTILDQDVVVTTTVMRPVTYLDASGTEQLCPSYTILTGKEMDLETGWYVAEGTVSFDGTISVNGDVHLILKDNAVMNVGTEEAPVGDGIRGWDDVVTVFGSCKPILGIISIYGQSTGANKGQLNVYASNNGISAGHGPVTINGGQVTTTGGNYGINVEVGSVTINGGQVTATGVNCGIRANNNITLGWNNNTDRIYANSYSGTVSVATGDDGDKKLYNGNRTFLGGDVTNLDDINGITLQPALSTKFVTADGTIGHYVIDAIDAIVLSPDQTTLAAGTYVAYGNTHYTSGITLTGNDVSIILADHCQMSVGSDESRINDNGIKYSGSSTLTITSQSLGSDMGALSVYTTGSDHYGIWTSAITVNGGNVTVDTDGPFSLALRAAYTDVTINGGTVSATATGSCTNAINAERNFKYNGGNVTANAVNGCAIKANGKLYTFNWRTPADRITIGSTGIATDGATVTFNRLFTDGTTVYSTTLTGLELSELNLNALRDVTLQPCAAVTDTDDNTDVINDYADQTIAVVLQGRTLYKDGDWNTLCLPFALGNANADAGHHFDGTPLEGATVMELDTEETYDNGKQTGLDGTTLNLYFKNATTIEAGKPYIVRWTTTGAPIVSPVFTGVTIDATNRDVTSTDGKVTFKGAFSPVSFTANDKTKLFLGAANTLYWPNADMTVNACRAYFQLGASPDPSQGGVNVREFRLNFGENEATGITTTNSCAPSVASERSSSDTNLTNKAGAWYDLQGRKLNKQPTKAGVYIHNGRKVVIK